jgi:hypothetical protein
MTETELDRTKQLALNIKESIETSTNEKREKLLMDLFKKWIVKPNQQNTMFDYLKLALSNFNLNTDNLQIGLFDRAQKVTTFELTYLHMFLMKDENLDDEKKNDFEDKFNKLFRAIIDAGNAISSSLYLVSSMTLEDIGKEKTTKAEMFRYSEMDYDNLSACQSLMLYLLEQLQRKEYRRYVVEDKGMCYQKIYNGKGHDTHAWKPAMTIKNFVIDLTRKELNANMWKNRTSAKENTNFVTRELTECLAPEFEDLSKDRHIFSFNNGVYITKIKADEDDEEKIWIDQWIPFEGPEAKKIGASVVSSKYIDLTFEDCSEKNGYDDWFDIIKKNCPSFTNVMEYQQWPEDVQRWLCILMGRMLYNIGELDDWQVYIFLLGMAGTGKCMRFGSKVMVYTGEFKEVQDIKVGDKLMGDDSTPRTVLNINKGYGKMFKIKQVSGDDYVVNGDHILSLKMTYCNNKHVEGKNVVNKQRLVNNKYYSVGDIVDISVNDYLKLSQGQKKSLKGYKVPIKFTEKEVPIDPYIIGLWLGDGTSANTGFTNQDSTVIAYLKKNLPIYDCYLQFFPKNTSGYGYAFSSLLASNCRGSNKILTILQNLNLINNKHIPDLYKYNSRENQLKILAGLIDTDGYLDNNCYDIVQKNYTLAKDIEYIARCLGFSSKVVECRKACVKPDGTRIYGTYYRQCISGNGLEDIPCLIPRKKAHSRKQIKNNLHTGIKIEPIEEDDYYGFQIDGNQRFVLGDHTVTHNSTIIENILKQFYEPADVGIVGNNAQKQFALSGLVGKKIILGPEIKGNWTIDQAELQSMISGESVSVNTKFKTASSEKFTSHLAIAGNVAPDFQDNAGSMSRRTVVFPFEYKVKKGDTKLGFKIQKELAYIIQACNKGYLDAFHKYGSSGIWEVLPELFKTTQESMAENTNALTHFLKTDLVVLGKDKYCREKVFVAAFNDHCKESHFATSKWTSQFYSGPFADFGIKLTKNCRRRYPNNNNARSYNGTFILGVDIKEGTMKEDEDDETTSVFDL